MVVKAGSEEGRARRRDADQNQGFRSCSRQMVGRVGAMASWVTRAELKAKQEAKKAMVDSVACILASNCVPRSREFRDWDL